MIDEQFRIIGSLQKRSSRETVADSLQKKTKFVIKRIFLLKGNTIINNILVFLAELILFVMGFVFIFLEELDFIKHNYKPSLKSVIILWVMVIFAGILLWLPMDYSRYYLPLIPCVVVMQACSIDRIISGVKRTKVLSKFKHRLEKKGRR